MLDAGFNNPLLKRRSNVSLYYYLVIIRQPQKKDPLNKKRILLSAMPFYERANNQQHTFFKGIFKYEKCNSNLSVIRRWFKRRKYFLWLFSFATAAVFDIMFDICQAL